MVVSDVDVDVDGDVEVSVSCAKSLLMMRASRRSSIVSYSPRMPNMLATPDGVVRVSVLSEVGSVCAKSVRRCRRVIAGEFFPSYSARRPSMRAAPDFDVDDEASSS